MDVRTSLGSRSLLHLQGFLVHAYIVPANSFYFIFTTKIGKIKDRPHSFTVNIKACHHILVFIAIFKNDDTCQIEALRAPVALAEYIL